MAAAKPQIQFAVVQANDVGIVHFPGGIDTAQVEPESWAFVACAGNGEKFAKQLAGYPTFSELEQLVTKTQALADL